ncbi:cytochrome P450 [Colletotrichum lupini]|uniref:Cytochrome P450 n=1 Tax=Colletotrichum lupini TaxID=145971 RepID=A0A9Q8WLK4_9PEZI|nr:cytochrome P450 [Colletotrichum lupini]UQC87756.1 cytochrome P450 [Colletotrichum lupini]
MADRSGPLHRGLADFVHSLPDHPAEAHTWHSIHKHAAKSIFGDIPDIKREPPGNLLIWIAAQSRRHNSPMFQVWLGPLTMVGH